MTGLLGEYQAGTGAALSGRRGGSASNAARFAKVRLELEVGGFPPLHDESEGEGLFVGVDVGRAVVGGESAWPAVGAHEAYGPLVVELKEADVLFAGHTDPAYKFLAGLVLHKGQNVRWLESDKSQGVWGTGPQDFRPQHRGGTHTKP